MPQIKETAVGVGKARNHSWKGVTFHMNVIIDTGHENQHHFAYQCQFLAKNCYL